MTATASTPVVLLVFNRPRLTARMLGAVRAAKPELVLVVGDGPRDTHPEDKARCAEVRQAVEKGIDWETKVLTNFSEGNLGCRERVSSGLTWAFEQVERAIILEDDCVPNLGFFRFCSELLQRYQDDSRIGCVTGDNFQPPGFQLEKSYYYSRYPHCWGWASWRRAWKFYDNAMKHWPELKRIHWLSGLFSNPLHARYWEEIFDRTYTRQVDSWAYVWTYSCWSQSMLSTLPTVNLVTNVGGGGDATHCVDGPLLHRPAVPMIFPLRHPVNVLADFQADDYSQRFVFGACRPKGWRAWLPRFLTGLRPRRPL